MADRGMALKTLDHRWRAEDHARFDGCLYGNDGCGSRTTGQAVEWQIPVLRIVIVVIVVIAKMIERKIKEGERRFAVHGDVVAVMLHQRR